MTNVRRNYQWALPGNGNPCCTVPTCLSAAHSQAAAYWSEPAKGNVPGKVEY